MPIIKVSAIYGPGISSSDGSYLASGDAIEVYLNSANFIDFKENTDGDTAINYNDPASPFSKSYVAIEAASAIAASANA